MNHPKVNNFENDGNELKTRLKHSLENAKKIIEKVKIKRQLDSYKQINKIKLDIGDLVLVKAENKKKNEPPYRGPYKVIDINDLNITININNKNKTFYKNMLKKYKN